MSLRNAVVSRATVSMTCRDKTRALSDGENDVALSDRLNQRGRENESPGRVDRANIAWALAGHRTALTKVALSAFLGGLLEALFLVLVTRVAFAITEGGKRIHLALGRDLSIRWTLLLAILMIALRIGLAAAASLYAAKLAADSSAQQRRRLSSAFLDASWETQQNVRSGSLQELVTTYSGQVAGIVSNLALLCLSLANLVAMLGIAVAVNPLGAMALVLSVAALSTVLRPIRSAIRRRSRTSAVLGMEFATTLNEISDLGLELHVFHVQDAAREKLERLIDRVSDMARRQGFAQGLISPVYSGLAYFALIGALGLVSLSNVASITSIGTVMLVMLRSLGYGQSLQNSYSSVVAGLPFVEQVRSRLTLFEAGRRHDFGVPVGEVGRLCAESMSFSYVEGQQVLTDLTFTIDPREIIGVVGPSGGGKSTLVQLLLGLRDPSVGRVTADGRDVGSFSRPEWARKITFVPQDPHLISGTIADNIRFFRSDVSDEQVERAARLAHLHDEIAAFPEGYLRNVGEHGGHLSGGQQQRLCIARALVENPDVLVLDEPTSALDVRSEHLIRSTLEQLRDRMTVIVIAHRISTLDICDRIMVIQRGEMRGFDSPVRLKESSEFYRDALRLSGMQ